MTHRISQNDFKTTIPLDEDDELSPRELREKRLIEAAKKRSSFSWRSPFGPVYQLPLLAISLVVYFAPVDVLNQYPMAGWFVSWVRSTLLQISVFTDINNFAQSTDYPQVALLACALHWAWLPVSIFLYVCTIEYCIAREGYVFWRYKRNGKDAVHWQDVKLVLTGVALTIFSLFVATMRPGDWSLMQGFTTQNRLVMLFIFWFGFWGSTFSCGTAYAFFRVFIDINLRGK